MFSSQLYTNMALISYSKLFLLNSCNSLHKFDNNCLSETYLDSNTPLDDGNLEIFGYALVCSDHPSNTKRGGACLCYKNNLPQRVINISYLNEFLILELNIREKIWNFVVLYRSPSQSQNKFETFYDNFEMTFGILLRKKSLFPMATMENLRPKLKGGIVKMKRLLKVTLLTL